MQQNREELFRRVRAYSQSEAQTVLRDYLLLLSEECKERLLNCGGSQADELRGFVKHLRAAFKEIDADHQERSKSNPYA